MVPNKANERLANTIQRVIDAVDLAAVSCADIDVFLDALVGEPFSQEKVRRILRRSGIEPFRSQRAAAANRASQTGPAPTKPTGSMARKSTCRLTCEQLDGRILPSQFGSPLGARVIDAYRIDSYDATVLTVVLWEDKGQADVQGMGPASNVFMDRHETGLLVLSPDALAALPVETLSSLFDRPENHWDANWENQTSAAEHVRQMLAWDFLDGLSGPAGIESTPLLLAS